MASAAWKVVLARLPVVFSNAYQFEYSIDFASHGAALANLGTARFQCWYRDPAAGGLDLQPLRRVGNRVRPLVAR